MSSFSTNCITPSRFASALAEGLDKDNLKAVRRPHNSTKADTTSWWVVPSSDRPFFKHGRFFTDWGAADRSALLAGFNISKGLSEGLSSAYSSRKGQNLIMDSKWTWNSFIVALKESRLSFPESFSILISGGYVQDPWEDPYSRNYGLDKYLLSFDGDKCKVKAVARDSMLLKSLNRVTDMKSLIAELAVFDKEDWLWLDILVYSSLSIQSGCGDCVEVFKSSFLSSFMEFYR